MPPTLIEDLPVPDIPNKKNSDFILGTTSPSLTLQNIKRSDDGEYTCLSSNSIGRGQSTVHIRVQCKIKKSLFWE